MHQSFVCGGVHASMNTYMMQPISIAHGNSDRVKKQREMWRAQLELLSSDNLALQNTFFRAMMLCEVSTKFYKNFRQIDERDSFSLSEQAIKVSRHHLALVHLYLTAFTIFLF